MICVECINNHFKHAVLSCLKYRNELLNEITNNELTLEKTITNIKERKINLEKVFFFLFPFS
jgi:hypothetical protein